MFVSVDGKAKKVTDIFAGGTDGKAHRITELFGSVNGVAKQLFSVSKSTNAFDQFTWEEIKQLANDGLLLEHFNLFDTVTIKLNTALVNNDFGFNYQDEEGNYLRMACPLKQKELYLQIVELTETKMRLMSPRTTIFNGDFDISTNSNSAGIESKRYYHWTTDWANNSGTARSVYADAWGLNTGYERLKDVENALPEDFRNVLSVVARPLIEYTKLSTGQRLTVYDEDMRIRQVSDDLWKAHINYDDVPYTIDLDATYYPRSFSEYGRYILLPRGYEQYKTSAVQNVFGTIQLPSTLRRDGSALYITETKSPYIAGTWDRDDYNTFYQYLNGCKKDYTVNNASWSAIIPEMIIAADDVSTLTEVTE